MGSCESMQTTHKACNHGGTPNKTLKILSIPLKNSHQCRPLKPARRRGYHIPQTTGWSDQVRDFGKFWEVLGMGAGETMQTTHKACNHGGTPIKILKISQDLSKTPTRGETHRTDCTPQRVSRAYLIAFLLTNEVLPLIGKVHCMPLTWLSINITLSVPLWRPGKSVFLSLLVSSTL